MGGEIISEIKGVWDSFGKGVSMGLETDLNYRIILI